MDGMGPLEFILGDAVSAAPPRVWREAKRSLLDLIGVAAAGRITDASRIVHSAVPEHWPAGSSRATLMFDGRSASAAGVAFAGAQTIDSIDAHDGFKPSKGHAGVTILPSLLAVMEAEGDSSNAAEFLNAFVVGYEIACRVAMAQHGTCPDYHGSGSWNSLGAAAIAARLLGLDPPRTRQALGIAEYFGPRSQIMRVVDHPTMVKDSSGWGAMVGVTATYLAASGFTGAPSLTVEDEEVGPTWSDLGNRWYMTEQYLKLWPVCRWAQPAIQAALDMSAAHRIRHEAIREVAIQTFHEACRLYDPNPLDTDQAQYDIAFPTACAFVRGRVSVDEIAGSGLQDEPIRTLAKKIHVEEREEFNAAFPARRFARLVIVLDDGRQLQSDVTEAPGDPEEPLSDEQVVDKFFALAAPVLGDEIATTIRRAIGDFDSPDLDLPGLLQVLRQKYDDFLRPSHSV